MTDVPIRDAPTRDALIALHFQNDICHPQGRIPFSLDRGSSEAQRFLDASKRTLEAARRAGWTIVHMHIVFAEDYSDLLRNCRLFQKAEALGALKRGSWGAAPFDGFEPRGGEIFVAGNGNSAFRRTGLEGRLGELAIERVNMSSAWRRSSRSSIPCATPRTWATASGCLPITALPATSRPIAHRCAR